MQADIIISNQAKAKNATPEPGFCKPSEEQKMILDQIVRFIDDPQQDFFILSGSAGTGKTTMVKALVEFMRKEFISFKLLAPTGRATRVLSTKTQHKVSTLHSFLYNAVESMDDLSKIIRIEFIPKEKEVEETTIYIIDEASLISDGINNSDAFISKASLLYDVVQWLYKSPEGSKIIFVGDEYQLPPINEAYSPALSKEYLENKFKLKGSKAALTEVFRQNESSYIYKNAALLKIAIDKNNIYYNRLKNKKLYNEKLAIDYYCKHFDEDSASNITFLAWKNQSVLQLNKKIRKRLFGAEQSVLVSGERIIVNRSNFGIPYLPNGEIGKVIEYYPETIEKIADFHFAEALFEFEDIDGEKRQSIKMFNLDYLMEGVPEDNSKKIHSLWHDRYRQNKLFRETKKANDDPYLNALDLRYGYVLTTHKAQGGEWDQVIMHPEIPNNFNRLKWLYTAVSRAKSEFCMYNNY